jgi:hypothetical protein
VSHADRAAASLTQALTIARAQEAIAVEHRILATETRALRRRTAASSPRAR